MTPAAGNYYLDFALHHVMARGIGRGRLLLRDWERNDFLERSGEIG